MEEYLATGIGIIILLLILRAIAKNPNYRDIKIPPRGSPDPELKPRQPVKVIVTMPFDLARAQRRKDLN